ncbi:S8 family serine peptidase [Pelotomaculum isophthalicicum JI]|uniref:S8 family serine peptidase n=1 Tax=Pelotomaculum isophthalicicum JI TaxID=947010 RepID=A0A9X4GYJ4_9FIRM|nr:S8 family serine peptidase [Pelotomaculum isophthalicicum]MDF9407880.1 S8 family serine peptidase [Pelotomaculum isophthalicicum JI]
MNCVYCHLEIDQGSKFCPYCGKEQPPKGPHFCGNCGRPLQEGDAYCGSCGAGTGSVPNQPVQPQGHSREVKPPKPPRRALKIGFAVAGVFFLLIIIVMMLSSIGTGLGKADVKLAERSALVKSAKWGEVPINQLVVVLKDGTGRGDADKVATGLGGKVVGYFNYLNLYQIETGARTEAELQQSIIKAKQDGKVELAFPNQQVFMDTRVAGTQCGSLDSPVYNEGDRGKGYEIIGVQRAWNIIQTAGFKTSDVHVGIVDNGLYKGKNEFDGKVSFDFPDKNGELKAPDKESNGADDPIGSHGTGVATIIAANPDNGGVTGVASVLGKNLKVSMVNNFAPPYGNDQLSTPDPNDPTKIVWNDGYTYAIGDLLALKKQIDCGSTIINCSWGNSSADPDLAKAYKKFFEKMNKDHPEVLFVCSAGNDGKALNGECRFPSGLALPNMVTVGNVMNDGTKCPSSNMTSNNFEVTLAAPGQQSVQGIGDDATIVNDYGGTSMATPHVTAAAAMLRSLNPKLSAGEIKKILVETALPGVTVGDHSNLAPPELGKGILAVDRAVLKVVNDLRQQKGLPALTMDAASAPGKIDLVAEGGPKEWKVTAMISGVGKDGTDVQVEMQGAGGFAGLSKQHLASDGSLTWPVTLYEESAAFHVKRLDSGVCWKVRLAPDISGQWSGPFTVETYNVPPDVYVTVKQGTVIFNINERQANIDPIAGDFQLIAQGGGTAHAINLNGSLQGRQVSLQAEEGGESIRFDGALEGDSMQGTWNYHGAFGNSTMTASGSWGASKKQ